MYAVESTEVWNKFVHTVEMLAVLHEVSIGAGCYVQNGRWGYSDRCHYERFVESAGKFKHAANLAFERAASLLLTEKGVNTAFKLAVKSAETYLEGFNFLLEMSDDVPAGCKSGKKSLETVLNAARAWE